MKLPYSLPLALGALVISATHSTANDWPQWRGPDRSDRSAETGLLKSWPEGGPKKVWTFQNAGLGYSGVSISRGKLFTLGARDGKEVLLALDATTGKELWASETGGVLKNNWGDGPRGTPTVSGGSVYAISGTGVLVCANVADGKVSWKKGMTELGGKIPGWGYTESPLVDGNKVICTPGGSEGAVTALDAKTGEVIWRTKDFTDGAQYSSVIPAKINGTDQYVQMTMQSVVGINPADGKLLWKSAWPGRIAVIPTPISADNHVYVTAGYGVGCKLIKIGADNQATDVWENKVMKNHHGGVILVDGYLYGHSDGAGWVCQNFKTGEEVWLSKSFGKGCVTYADGMLYCLEEGSGNVVLVKASPEGWSEISRFTLQPQTTQRSPSGRIWTHPVISNGKLFLRDQEIISCYDVKGS